MNERKRVVLIGVDDAQSQTLEQSLDNSYEVIPATISNVHERIGGRSGNVYVVNFAALSGGADTLIRDLRSRDTTGDVIAFADMATRDRAAAAVDRGAFCFMLFPIDLKQFATLINRAFDAVKGRSNHHPPTTAEAKPPNGGGPNTPTNHEEGFVVPPGLTLEEVEKATIYQTLKRTKGNKQAAANALGIYRPRLYSKIKKYNMTEFM